MVTGFTESRHCRSLTSYRDPKKQMAHGSGITLAKLADLALHVD